MVIKEPKAPIMKLTSKPKGPQPTQGAIEAALMLIEEDKSFGMKDILSLVNLNFNQQSALVKWLRLRDDVVVNKIDKKNVFTPVKYEKGVQKIASNLPGKSDNYIKGGPIKVVPRIDRDLNEPPQDDIITDCEKLKG